MALLGGIQRRDLPGQIVVPRPGAELVNAHRHNPLKANRVNPAVSQAGVRTDDAKRCVAHRILKSAGGT